MYPTQHYHVLSGPGLSRIHIKDLLQLEGWKVISLSQNHGSSNSPADDGTPTMPDQRLIAAGWEEDHQPHFKDICTPTKPDTPTLFLKSRHDGGQSSSKALPEFNPDDLVGRTFLLTLETMGRD